jgi:hypothetical protein
MARDNIARGLALGAGRVIVQSAVAVPNTGNTTENTVATITVPANSMGLNGRIRLDCDVSGLSGTGTKTIRVRFGGTTLFTRAAASTDTETVFDVSITNRNAANSQRYSGRYTNSIPGSQAFSGTTAIDTTADATLLVTIQNSNSADTSTLESYSVILYPKG